MLPVPPSPLFLSGAISSSNAPTSIGGVLQEYSSIFGIRLWVVIVSVLFTLFLILTFLCLCIPSFRLRFRPCQRSYEPRFRLSKPFATKDDHFGRGRESVPSFGRRLLPFNASEVEMDFIPGKQGMELEALWSAHKAAPYPASLTGDVEAFGVHALAGNVGRIWYTAKEIESATNGFDRGNLIGCGESGAVYRGVLFNGARVAVKRLITDSYDGGDRDEELKIESDALTNTAHNNLVKLLGYCLQDGVDRMLIYEYVDNGSLHHWLHVYNGKPSPLTWDRRMTIIRGTAKGLAYLHEDLSPVIIHGNIKSSKILLDRQWNPKITDIGSAMPLDAGWSPRTPHRPSSRAQEMAITETPTEMTDVYCFGILIMEIVTGRLPVDESQPEVYLIDWVKSMVANQEVAHLLDPWIPEIPPPKDLKRILLIALMCVDPDLSQRPNIGHVVHMLESHTFLVHAFVGR